MVTESLIILKSGIRELLVNLVGGVDRLPGSTNLFWLTLMSEIDRVADLCLSSLSLCFDTNQAGVILMFECESKTARDAQIFLPLVDLRCL